MKKRLINGNGNDLEFIYNRYHRAPSLCGRVNLSFAAVNEGKISYSDDGKIVTIPLGEDEYKMSGLVPETPAIPYDMPDNALSINMYFSRFLQIIGEKKVKFIIQPNLGPSDYEDDDDIYDDDGDCYYYDDPYDMDCNDEIVVQNELNLSDEEISEVYNNNSTWVFSFLRELCVRTQTRFLEKTEELDAEFDFESFIDYLNK